MNYFAGQPPISTDRSIVDEQLGQFRDWFTVASAVWIPLVSSL
jgi:hypothetical protein